MTNICFNLNNTLEISNNNYIFNQDFTHTNYSLYQTTQNKIYSIENIPKTHPMGFYDASSTSEISDISNLIKYDVSYEKAITIYVSQGSDLSFSNNNYYRFFDESFNLINIPHSNEDTVLTNSGDNFYFMRSMKYTFIAIQDFCNNHPFSLSGEALSESNNDLHEFVLLNQDDSFNIIIPKTSDNINNTIFYTDYQENDISATLNILVDASNISYYYGKITFSVDPSYETHFNLSKISIKSFPKNDIHDINNINIFDYSSTCNYILNDNLNLNYLQLFNQNIECLNLVSQAKLKKDSNDRYYYEFNVKNHGYLENSDITFNGNLENLDYGLYDGSYVIFDVSETYAITIENSTLISIDDNDYDTSIRDGPSNTRYYYGIVRIIVNNQENENEIENISIPIKILDYSDPNNPIVYESSNNFIYKSLCQDSDSINNINKDLSFVLFNRKNQPFTDNEKFMIDNIYNLNLYENYEELVVPYRAVDRYNHDISNLITSSLLNIYKINYNLPFFLKIYTLKDYQKNKITRERVIRFQRGPFIEISGNNEIFNDSDPYTNTIEIYQNDSNPLLNFFKNLDVYVYNKSREKVNLPFEISLKGTYVDISGNLINKSVNILEYDEEFSSRLNLSYNYYLSNNIRYSPTIQEIIIINISYLNKTNEEFNEENLISYDTSSIKLGIGRGEIISIDNSSSTIILNQKYDANNKIYDLITTIRITNYDFNINIESNNDIHDIVTPFIIEGSFNSIDFFNFDYIDSQYIGNYEISVYVKGLSNEDFIFYDLSNDLDMNSLILDFSRTFFVNVKNNINIVLNFVNYTENTKQYDYKFSKNLSFNIFDNIEYYRKENINSYLQSSNIPLLEISSNSIYISENIDDDLSYNIHIYNIELSNNELNVQDKSLDASATIVYKLIDSYNNESNDVTLNIEFINIPFLELSGHKIVINNLSEIYEEPGLFLKGISNDELRVIYTPIPNSNGYLNNNETFEGYDISWSTNLNIHTIGLYNFTYEVNINGFELSYEKVYITRFIQVVDIISPFFRFPDLSYIDTGKVSFNINDYLIPYTLNDYKPGNNLNIDFSLSVFSTFTDFSSIIYKFDVSDNYFPVNNLTTSITLSISGEGNKDFADISIGQFLRSNNYLSDDNCFNKVTIGLNKLEPLKLYYNITDPCDNSFNITRIVDIVDIVPPRIDFTDYLNISFNAINFKKDENTLNTLIKELSNNIFSFTLTDNYEISSSNYNITIEGKRYIKENIKTIQDLCNNQDQFFELFSKIDTSLVIIYDISDNQFNSYTESRILNIINEIPPKSPIINNGNNTIEIDFGDYNKLSNIDISLLHPRLLISDISLDISYILPQHVTSFYGEFDYDASALIYSYSAENSSISYDISFYSVSIKDSLYLKSDEIKVTIIITNNGPIFDNNIVEVIYHQVGNFFSDASFILGVNATSIFDRFYYSNYFPEISYLYTNYDISYDVSFNVNNPEIGEYNILYTAKDKNEQITVKNRIIKVIDYNPPIISLSIPLHVYDDDKEEIKISQYEELSFNIFFSDDSDLSGIIIKLLDSSDNLIRDIINRNFYSSSSKKDYTYSSLLLNSNDTSYGNISYKIEYNAFDIYDNSATKTSIILIEEVLPKIIKIITISGNILYLDDSFDTSFNRLVSSGDLSLIFNEGDITYNNNTITYDVKKVEFYRLLDFSMHIIHQTQNIIYSSEFIIDAVDVPDKDSDKIIDIQNAVYFYYHYSYNELDENEELYEDNGFAQDNITIIFRDNAPPDLSFILSSYYTNISNIVLPLLSIATYNSLNENPSYFNNKNLFDFDYFTKDDNNNIIFSIPGITIVDILGNTIQSLENETIINKTISFEMIQDISNNNNTHNLNFNIIYNNYYTPIIIDITNNSSVTQEISNNLQDSVFTVEIKNVVNKHLNYQDVSNIVEISFNYNDNTIDTFKYKGINNIEFYDTSKNWTPASTYLNTITKPSIIHRNSYNPQDDNIKNYLIEYKLEDNNDNINIIIIFTALDNSLNNVHISYTDGLEDASLNIKINEKLQFDISNSYLLLNEGNYKQTYSVKDYNQSAELIRYITVKKFDPFIKLTYDKDDNNNYFLKSYNQQYTKFDDPMGEIYDYYHGNNNSDLYEYEIIVTKPLIINNLGLQHIIYNVSGNAFDNVSRPVQIVNITCLADNEKFDNLLNRGINNKYGLYNNNYIINVDNSCNAIRLSSSVFDLINSNVDISNLININGEKNYIYNGYTYYWGQVNINVTGNFNRANIEYLTISCEEVKLEDIFLYTTKCLQISISELPNRELIPTNSFSVDVSGYNIESSEETQFFTLTGVLYPSNEDRNRRYIDNLKRANLHLSIGKYTFVQNKAKNFYNRIKFSTTRDGTHTNGGTEYKKGVKEYGLAGLSNGYTELILSATTPSPLYYYSENFPNMGGKIETRNNLIIHEKYICINDNILSQDLSNNECQKQNKIFLKQLLKRKSGSNQINEYLNCNCITQQNINHNMIIDTTYDNNRIIFKKYETSADSYVRKDNSNNYLFDMSVNSNQSYVFQFNCFRENTENYNMKIYENKDNKNILLLNNNLRNYYYFFKKYELLDICYNIINFANIIDEIQYANYVSLKSYGNGKPTEINYFKEQFFINNSSEIEFSNIFDNLITFNLQTYIDLSIIETNIDTIKSNIDSIETTINTNYPIKSDKTKLFFQEFVINILSDISGISNTIIPSDEQSILLYNGLIELNEHLLDSHDSSGILYELYDDEINSPDKGLHYVNEELKNKVFLSIRDISMESNNHDYNEYIGLTMQNIFHNMYFDENNVLIFHSYDNSVNNFKVNEPTLTLEKTMSDYKNNKKYLLELSSNDIYGCYKNTSDYINDNSNSKVSIIYFFKNELEVEDTNLLLDKFNITPISLNDLCYNLYPYSYNILQQSYNSHSYLIDLNDYFDRYFYITTSNIPSNVFKKNNIFYTIIDISYLNEFNLFDVSANENIVYDKSKKSILDNMRDILIIYSFKLDHIYNILEDNIDNKEFNNELDYDRTDYYFINNNNNLIHSNTFLPGHYKFIDNHYLANNSKNNYLVNNSLNKVYSNNYYNKNKLQEKYLKIKSIGDIYYPLDLNEYTSHANFNKIEQLVIDISNLTLNIDNIYDKIYEIYGETILRTNYIYSSRYSDYKVLADLFNSFNAIKENYNIIIIQLEEQAEDKNKIIEWLKKIKSKLDNSNYNIWGNYVNLYDINLINNFIENLFINFKILNNELIFTMQTDICYNNSPLFQNVNIDNSFCVNYTSINDISNNSSNVLSDLSKNIRHIEYNYQNIIEDLSGKFVYNDKYENSNINYFMSGSKLLINSFNSNSLKIKFNINYNSYLYPDTYVDNIILDIAIPDYIPPTIIFKNKDISFSQELLASERIDELVNLLIEDISFIEINQVYDVSFNLTNLYYNDDISKNNSDYSTILINIDEVIFNESNIINISISYTVIDNANNRNIIKRGVAIEKIYQDPIFLYNNIFVTTLSVSSLVLVEGTIITDNIIREGITAEDPEQAYRSLTLYITYNIYRFDYLSDISFVKQEVNLPIKARKDYNYRIVYQVKSNNTHFKTILERKIIVTDKEVDTGSSINHCPCPVFYKPIQHNYKLGSSASNSMRLARIILKR